MKVTTLKGIFPDPKPVRRKNFIQENVRNLRRMEQCFQSNKEVDKLEKLQVHKHKAKDKYQSVTAKVVTSFRDKKPEQRNVSEVASKHLAIVSVDKAKDEKPSQNGASSVEPCRKHVGDSKKASRTHTDNDTSSRQKKSNKHKSEQKQQSKDFSESDQILRKSNDNAADYSDAQSSVKYRSQGIQTLDTDDAESIYSEGVILYSSKKRNDTANKGDLNQQEESPLRKQSSSPTDRGDMHTPEDSQKTNLGNSVSPTLRDDDVGFAKGNKERTTVATKLATQLNNGVPPANYRKGVVPKYLRDRKEAQEKEQKAKAEALQTDCPDGHISLPDHERKETLRLLKKNYQDYINELNMMPIKTDTLRAQRRKMEIEKQLSKLEEGIKVFSRPKVYVKINA